VNVTRIDSDIILKSTLNLS